MNGYEDLGFAKIDHGRKTRNGYPEIIYGESKTPRQAALIFSGLAEQNNRVLCTRADKEIAEAVRDLVPDAYYHMDMPKMTVEASGCGMGTRDIGRPNIFRVILGTINTQKENTNG